MIQKNSRKGEFETKLAELERESKMKFSEIENGLQKVENLSANTNRFSSVPKMEQFNLTPEQYQQAHRYAVSQIMPFIFMITGSVLGTVIAILWACFLH